MPQQGRVLEPANGDLHDSGRHLHAGVPLLRHPYGAPFGARSFGAAARGRKRPADGSPLCRDHLRDARRPARRRCGALGRHRPRNPVAESGYGHRTAYSRLACASRSSGYGDRVGARHHRTQHRDRRTAHSRRTLPGEVPYEPGDPALPERPGRRDEERSDARPGRNRRGDPRHAARPARCGGARPVTLGQYLRPTLAHYPVAEYVSPERFGRYRDEASEMGFDYCASAPMVRSSYLAEEALRSVAERQER